MTKHESVVGRNIRWFLRSGVMRPADGFWGVAERLAVTKDNQALEAMTRAFPCQTRLAPDVVAVEHRRADCNVEVAYLFDLAAEAFGRPAHREIADTLLDFLLARSGLRDRDANSPTFGLWGWSVPVNSNRYWTDDNAWVITLLLKLAARGRPALRPLGIQAARTLNGHLRAYFRMVAAVGRDIPRSELATIPMAGLMPNPHWIGLACMALAHAAAEDAETDYRPAIDAYYDLVLEGPPPSDRRHAMPPGTSRVWSMSEYAYLAMGAAVVARQFPQSRAPEMAAAAGALLLAHQGADGHFFAEHDEAPAAPHLADLVYTENWAVLGFHHLHALTGEKRYLKARDLSLRFLASIQDRSESPLFSGCWRGMYDTLAGRWGGGDRFEGGASSIYSGWTNAPIAWAFLFASGIGSLFPADGRRA